MIDDKFIEEVTAEAEKVKTMDDPNDIAEALSRFASYYATLGRALADAENDEMVAGAEYEFMKASLTVQKIQEGKVAVKLAEKQAHVDAEEGLKKRNRLKYQTRLLFITRQSLDKTMDVLRSRLSRIKTEMEGNNRSAV